MAFLATRVNKYWYLLRGYDVHDVVTVLTLQTANDGVTPMKFRKILHQREYFNEYNLETFNLYCV